MASGRDRSRNGRGVGGRGGTHLVLGCALAALFVASSCSKKADQSSDTTAQSTTTIARSGVVRVGLWSEPNQGANTPGGWVVMELTQPSLFQAAPDGSWVESLVEPESVTESPHQDSARFRLRQGARWSDGRPITAADLRRTASKTFVDEVLDEDPEGFIEVRFTQPLPNWRMLWSGTNAIASPTFGVYGGPFVVDNATTKAGLVTVLKANEEYWGEGPYLESIELYFVSDVITARQLLANGSLDVLSPPPSPQRTTQLDAIDGVEVVVGDDGSGWWWAIDANENVLDQPSRSALLHSFDRNRYANTLLTGEVNVITSLNSNTSQAGTWYWWSVQEPAVLDGQTIDFTAPLEDPNTPTITRSIEQRVDGAGGELSVRQINEGGVFALWNSPTTTEYGGLLVAFLDPAEGVCWTCLYGGELPMLASAADAGDVHAQESMQVLLRDKGFVLPLWRPIPVVAYRTTISGVEINGWAAGPAWNAATWTVAS